MSATSSGCRHPCPVPAEAPGLALAPEVELADDDVPGDDAEPVGVADGDAVCAAAEPDSAAAEPDSAGAEPDSAGAEPGGADALGWVRELG
ncbi:MAG: hypothetical protein ACRDOE_06690, partial [Streptosporangiaceae bacterium]